MEINADFGARAAVHTGEMPWVASPMAGVERRMLDRLGDEVARATSLVRYAPGSAFSAHVHSGGEEFLVLDGVFSDEHGDFPAGSYVRNPPQSAHTPSSAPGCIILVKLWQMDPEDRTHVRIDTNKMAWLPDPERAGVMAMSLFADGQEDVRLERWAAGAEVSLKAPKGMELYVLTGGFEEAGERFAEGGWLRLPKGAESAAVAGADGATVWVKRDHLAEAPEAPG